ncbi:MAG TPA: hypothetical protein VHB70_13690 [Parafilimonas sp.]|nr:hypothetical protein [Parafilimonas sp.]
MEVHHHPKVEKKNFKEYFLEFLMIFLAVTLGFFAENIREKITEHKRAKIYAATMVSDLKADTSSLIHYLNYWDYAANNVDTLFQLLSKLEPAKIPSGKLYWYGLFGGAPNIFISNDATFQEMKSAGALSYFNTSLAQKITQYDQLTRRMRVYDEQDATIFSEVRKLRSQLFYVQFNEQANVVYQSTRGNNDRQKIDSFIQSNPPLLSTDKTIFNQYLEMVRSRFIPLKLRNADTLLTCATGIIRDLKKEYQIEN